MQKQSLKKELEAKKPKFDLRFIAILLGLVGTLCTFLATVGHRFIIYLVSNDYTENVIMLSLWFLLAIAVLMLFVYSASDKKRVNILTENFDSCIEAKVSAIMNSEMRDKIIKEIQPLNISITELKYSVKRLQEVQDGNKEQMAVLKTAIDTLNGHLFDLAKDK